MHISLVVDQSDYRWQLLGKLLNIFDLRKVKRVIAKFTSPIKTAINCMKVTLTSMFFSTTISHVVEELKRRDDLRKFLGMKEEEVPKEGYVYAFLSRFNLNSFVSMTLRILNSVTRKRARNTRVIVNCTDVSVDINWFRKPVRQRDLEGGQRILCGDEAHACPGTPLFKASPLFTASCKQT